MASASAPEIQHAPTPEPRLYPDLGGGEAREYFRQDAYQGEDDSGHEETQDFRLNRVSMIEAELRQERDARRMTYKKYNRAIGVVDTVTSVSSAVTVVTGPGASLSFLPASGSRPEPRSRLWPSRGGGGGLSPSWGGW